MRTFSVGRAARVVFLVGVTVVWLLPVYLVVVNAITDSREYQGEPRWLPGSFGFPHNVAEGWEGGPFLQTAINSLVYALVCAAAAVLVATLAAYALVVLHVKRPALWFWIIYSGTLLPLQVFARPLFLAAAETNLYDTQVGLAVVYVALCVPFALFVTRNMLSTVPLEIAEAAKLDGADWLTMFLRIHLPLLRPAMAAAFVFQFVYIWNELFFGITLSISPTVQPVMASLAGLQGDFSGVGLPSLLAVAVVVSLPTIALFFGFQRFFVSSLKSNL
jgi:ABC-type glycerol-3-phosphate transport system permease component